MAVCITTLGAVMPSVADRFREEESNICPQCRGEAPFRLAEVRGSENEAGSVPGDAGWG